MFDHPKMLTISGPEGLLGFKLLTHDTAIFKIPCYGMCGLVSSQKTQIALQNYNAPSFISIKIESEMLPDWQDILLRYEFAFIDTELHLSGVLNKPVNKNSSIEFSCDPNLVNQLSPSLFFDLPSRFNKDRHLSKEKVAAFWNCYLKDLLEQQRAWAIFPLINNAPVGVCLFNEHKKYLSIQLIILAPEIRGQGIASSILTHAAQIRNIQQANTEVYTSSKKAINFYMRNGLKHIDKVYHVLHRWNTIYE